MTNKKIMYFLSAFLCACFAGPWFISRAFAGQETPTVDKALDLAAKELDKAKDETQKLKDLWDKTRLETTLYDQRAKRAYKKWQKAAKSLKEQARIQKDKAELEFQLAVEKRKLAYNEWQASQLRQLARESQVKALDLEKDGQAIRDKIRRMESKLTVPGTGPTPGRK
jgi:hypothetical protein